MNDVSTFSIITLGLLWAVMVAIRAWLPGRDVGSLFDLKHQASGGDESARQELQYLRIEHRLRALKEIFWLVVLVVFTAVSVYYFGGLQGGAISIALGLLGLVIARQSVISRMVNQQINKKQAGLINLAAKLRLLDMFARPRPDIKQRAASKAELIQILNDSKSVLAADELTSLKSLLHADSKKVGEIMTPRSKIESIVLDEGVGPLVIDALHKTGYRQFPVYKASIDQVVGMLHLDDLIDLKSAHGSVKDAMRPQVYYLNENQPVRHALHGFLHTGASLFIVVNDKSETTGVLNLKDVVVGLLGHEPRNEFDDYQNPSKVAALYSNDN